MSDDASRRAVGRDAEHPPEGGVTRLRNRRAAKRAMAAQNAVPAPADDSANKVVHIVRRLQEDISPTRSKRRLSWTALSALVCILLPTLLVALFYIFIAADRYVAEARFSVRSNDGQAADALGIIAGMPKATIVSDSYIVIDYIRSREMVQELESRLPLRAIYARSEGDFLTRLDPEESLEGLVSYWNDRIDVFYDATKNTIAVQVEAFTAEDAQRIVAEMVEATRALINNLSAQARRDAVQFAATEVARAELRIRGARSDIATFRAEQKEFDPAQTASAALTIIAGLEGKRSQLNSQLAAIESYLSDEAPSVQMLKTQIEAIETEIERVQNEMSTAQGGGEAASQPGAGPLPSVLAQYQELLLNQQFAENAYTAALASQERARAEADRQQSYLAMFVHPRVPEEALYPDRMFNILVALVLFTALWAVGALLVLTVRDHIR